MATLNHLLQYRLLLPAMTFLLFKLHTLHKETLHWNHQSWPTCWQHAKTPQLGSIKNLNSQRYLQNRNFPSSCFLGVFRNCIIDRGINVCIWQIVKLWVSRSHGVMTVVCWISTTVIPRQWHQGGCSVTTLYHEVQISQSENRNSNSVWKLNN